jgi:hypothetical protein
VMDHLGAAVGPILTTLFLLTWPGCLGSQFKWNFFCRFCESLLGVRFLGSGAWDGWGRAAEHKALAAWIGPAPRFEGPHPA